MFAHKENTGLAIGWYLDLLYPAYKLQKSVFRSIPELTQGQSLIHNHRVVDGGCHKIGIRLPPEFRRRWWTGRSIFPSTSRSPYRKAGLYADLYREIRLALCSEVSAILPLHLFSVINLPAGHDAGDWADPIPGAPLLGVIFPLRLLAALVQRHDPGHRNLSFPISSLHTSK